MFTNIFDYKRYLNSNLEDQSKNLGGLRFGVDGDGNGGYYKADDSFVPFKSTKSFVKSVDNANFQINVSELVDNFSNLTVDNFIVEPLKFSYKFLTASPNKYYYNELTTTKSYDESTGILSVNLGGSVYSAGNYEFYLTPLSIKLIII